MCVIVYIVIFTFSYPHFVQFGQTALYCASRNGHVEVVQLLLQWHADASICDMVYTSVLLLHVQQFGG